MKCDLIIDGNYVLNKLVHSLYKSNVLYGSLEESLNMMIQKYRRYYSFSNVYLVSDMKSKSWRHSIYSEYKAKRKYDSDIDWNFVFETYAHVKSNLGEVRVKVRESEGIEGDDWIYFLAKKSNASGRSCMIISNDQDMNQLINISLEPQYMNFMVNERYSNHVITLPTGSNILLSELSKMKRTIFDMNTNEEFVELINTFIERNKVIYVNSSEELVGKLIMGDTSDNILSVYRKECITIGGDVVYKGIGEASKKKIIDIYRNEYGEVDINDDSFYEKISDIICEVKKVKRSNIPNIIENIKYNKQLISFDMIPSHIIDIIKEKNDEFESKN